MAQKTRFTEEVVPLRGKYAGRTILVSPRQKKRLLYQKKVRLPRTTEKKKGKIKPKETKVEKEVEKRQDK